MMDLISRLPVLEKRPSGAKTAQGHDQEGWHKDPSLQLRHGNVFVSTFLLIHKLRFWTYLPTKSYPMETVYTGSNTAQLGHPHVFYSSIPVFLVRIFLFSKDHLKIYERITNLVISIANHFWSIICMEYTKKALTSIISIFFLIIQERRITSPLII